MIIYFDMDGVLCDLVGSWLTLYNNEFGGGFQNTDIIRYNIESILPQPREEIRKYLHQPKFWENLQPIEEMVHLAKSLQDEPYKNVYVATVPYRSDNCCWEKTLWVEQHLPTIGRKGIFFTHNKSLLIGDVLIDDDPKKLIGFRGLRILYSQPWNIYAKFRMLFDELEKVNVEKIYPIHRAYNANDVKSLIVTYGSLIRN